jgi:hypothetical protein
MPNMNSITRLKLKIKLQQLMFSVCLVCFLFTKVYSQTSIAYNWKNVQIKGGGYVPAIVYSKAEKDLLYARTDVGGAYRWNATNKTWTPLTDGFIDGNSLGILSLAADPSNANNVYLATGLYTASWGANAAFYASKDKGTTWTKVNWPFKLGGNEVGRGSGERLQVDPNLGSILYMGSSKDGLWKSTDYGITWAKITTLPAAQITFVALDPLNSIKGAATKDIYVGTSDHFPSSFVASVYKSSDAGFTWSLIPNQPIKLDKKSYAPANVDLVAVASRMVVSGDNIYISYGNDLPPNCINGAVYRYNKITGIWTNLTTTLLSSQGGYSGVTVHPTNPNIILISSLGRWYPWADELHISTDGGASWNPIFLQSTSSKVMKAIFNTSSAPYASKTSPHWISDVEIDPFNADNAIFGTGGGIFMTGNLSQAFTNLATTWTYTNDGLEETVPIELICPPTGAPLLSALGDVTGFKHDDLSVSPANGTYSTGQGTNTGIDFAEGNAAIVVRAHSNGTTKGSYSLDGGITWSYFGAQPSGTTGGGTIGVSADGKTIVWAPTGAADSYSLDNGTTWTASTGLPATLKPVADRMNNTIFYAYSGTTGQVYKSIDGGKTFAATAATLPTIYSWEYSASIAAVFGKSGHIWVTTGNGGLHYSTNGGTTFTKVAAVNAASKVTFGKPAIGSTYPTVFIAGTVNTTTGLFRSDDQGATWAKINDVNHEYGRSYSCLAADRNVFGRLYLGTSRGILYGDAAVVTSIAYAIEEKKAEVYPNPFEHGITIKSAGIFQYVILDILGKEVEDGKGENTSLAGEHLTTGIYILKIKTESDISFFKISKN